MKSCGLKKINVKTYTPSMYYITVRLFCVLFFKVGTDKKKENYLEQNVFIFDIFYFFPIAYYLVLHSNS